ncbi:eukaryotic translation initiation factor-like protein [Rhynchospora pubera]|uniref:Eukaryotic translation initiation factor-like protein n=1 Tax=Rhynchospora pubera TaxID=906938 RepID=A0AAV8H6V9_9POAL|nr:eukaryotic translation initiation factor-like protein [Rhynchospora pubera]
MSKKKSATTMTLKDFHGGSIPSDFPLPSAPGVSVRPSQERPTAAPSRSERMRHISASTAAISPLPAPPRVIGRHFDEDERTPFDAPPRVTATMPVATGAWAQRKEQSNPAMGLAPAGSGAGTTVWSPSRVAQASAVEKVISGRWHSSSRSDHLVPPVSDSDIRPPGAIGFGSGDSYAPGFGLDQRAVPYGSVFSENRIMPPVEQQRFMSGPGYGFDLKVPQQTDTVVSGYGDVHFSGIGSDQRQVHRTGLVGENQVRSVADEPQVKQVGLGSELNLPERTRITGPGIDDSYRHGSSFESRQRPVARTGVIGENRVKPVAPETRRVGSGTEDMYGFGINRKPNYNNWEERPRSVGVLEQKDKIGLAIDSEGKEIERPASHEGRFVAGPSDQKGAERPRLKLLPRTKPIENQEIRVTEDKVGFELYSSPNVPAGNDLHDMDGIENANANKGGNNVTEVGLLPNERPRLNLKPRSQPVGPQSEETGGNERPSVFGGARPRELVLKDRGVDLAVDDVDNNLPPNRYLVEPNSSSVKPDTKPEPIPTKTVGNWSESYQSQQRNIRNPNTNQKEHHPSRHQHQPDPQRTTWRDNMHNGANNRRGPHQNQHQQPPRPDPDTWRKPEPAKQEDLGGSRPGKGASALELAEAFSKRVSVGKPELVGRNNSPVVFSRLVGGERELYKGPPPHQQINGY